LDSYQAKRKVELILISKNMTFPKIAIGGFALLTLVFAALIFKLNFDDKRNWIANKAARAKIVDIYGGYKGKPNHQIMELSDGQHFTVPQNLLGKLSVGDSVFKEKGQNFYRFKLMKTQSDFRENGQ
jgi:hypothetical protein